VLIAPFAGVIADINGELNEYVTPSPPGIQTLPVIDLIEPGCFLVSAPIDEVDAPKIHVGLPARMTLDAWRGREFAGKVMRVGSYVIDLEKQARTVEVELAFSNPADLKDLLVGYSADVDIILETRANVLRIPTEAVQNAQVFVLENGVLHKRKITAGLSNWTYTEVSDGLAEQTQVVTTPGAAGVADGVAAKAKSDEQ
jgi:HlyD family secretion protein